MKNLLKYTAAVVAGMCLTTSCMNSFDEEQVDTSIVTADNVGTPNATITGIRSQYASAISNSSWQVVESETVIEGIVTANDISGNLYQQILIQELGADGRVRTDVPGIMVGMKGLSCFYTIFPVGQKIRINLKGLYVGGYGKQAKIGQPYMNTNGAFRMGPMSLPYIKSNIQKVGTPDATTVEARPVTPADITSGNIDKLTPMLVKMEDVTIPDAKSDDAEKHCFAHAPYSSSTYSVEHTIKFNNGGVPSSCTLYTSTSALFASEKMPQGTVTIYGMLGRYNNNYQMQMRDLNDIKQ